MPTPSPVRDGELIEKPDDPPKKRDFANTPTARKERHRRLRAWFWQEMRRQQANRFQMALDEDFYDSDQWRSEDARKVIKRGQMPVAWNETKPTADWLIGTERRTRVDFNIIARNDRSEEASQDAKTKQKLLKYIDDVNRAGHERSEAFKRAVKAGLGWIEIGVRGDPDQELIYIREESWRNILYDSLGTRLDLDDSRYLFRFRWVDVDVAKVYFPGNDAAIERAMVSADEEHARYWLGKRMDEYDPVNESFLPPHWTHHDSSAWLNNPRQRVMLIEAWSREPFRGTGAGAGTNDRAHMRMRCTIMTDQEILTGADDWSPYRHNRFPFVPVWCYRRGRDNAPYGVIRPIRGPQEAVNKMASKAVWEVSANQHHVEKGAIDTKVMDEDEMREELAAPDGLAIFADGAVSGNKVKSISRPEKVQGNMQLMQYGTQAMRNMAGVTGENRGMDTNAQSGRAVIAKQEQGGLVTAEIFDNTLLSRQMEGEITLSLVEQYYNEPKVFSIAGDRNRYQYEQINTLDPVTGQIVNDITQRSAQFIIGEQAWRASLMQAMGEAMMELLGQISQISPEAVRAMLIPTIELLDIPNKRATMRSLREAFGQPDPDEPMSPEQQLNVQKQQQLADARFRAELATLQAQVYEAKSKGLKLDAEHIGRRVQAIYEALQAAQVVSQVPHVAPIGDEILKSSGFTVPAGGQDPNIPAPGQAGVAPAVPGAAPTQNAAAAAPAQPSVPEGGIAAPVREQLPELLQKDGVRNGIETMRPDGVRLN